MSRNILLTPREITITTTLSAKIPTITIGTGVDNAKQNEFFITKTGHAFVADATGFNIAGVGSAVVANKMVPIMTPIDILPRFSAPTVLGTGSEILLHTADIRSTPDTNGKFKQISLLDIKSWIGASIQGDLDNVGKSKVDAADTTYGYLGAKIKGTTRTTGVATEVVVTASAAGNKTITISAVPYFDANQIAMDSTATPTYSIIAINGGTI